MPRAADMTPGQRPYDTTKQLLRLRLAKDAMDRDWSEPLGVTFIQEPQDRPYGTEAIFRDDSATGTA